MAIEQYTGVTKVDENYYEVTAVVELDETNSFAVGDMADCTFVASSGGVLKFKEGTSTFTNCTFLELSDAWNAGVGQYYTAAPNNPRFLSPNGFIFKGCTWVLGQPNCAWETATSGEYNFLVDDFGEPCRVKQVSSNAAGVILQVHSSDAALTSTISGLVFDTPNVVTLEQSTDTVKGIRVKDNDPGNFAQANVGFQIQTWDPDYAASLAPYGARQRFYELEARCVNVQLASTANRASERAVILVDPIGRILKTTDNVSVGGDYARGILETWRTLSGNFIDIATKAAISECRTVVTKDSDSSVQLDETAGSFSVELKQLEQGLNSQTVVEDGDYTAKFLAYGYDLQTRGVTIGDTTNPQEYAQGAILLFQDSNVTERDEATVAAYTSLSTTPQIYDYFKHWEMTLPTEEVGNPYVTINTAGDTLDFGDKDVYFGEFGSGSPILYFDNSYVPPAGTTGDTFFGGYLNDNPTIEYDNTLIDIPQTQLSGRDGNVRTGTWGMDIKPDGTQAYVYYASVRSDGDTLGTDPKNRGWFATFDLSTPYDMATATYTKIDIVDECSASEGAFYQLVDNGNKLFMHRSHPSQKWRRLDLTNPYDFTSFTDTGWQTTPLDLNEWSANWTDDGYKLVMAKTTSSPSLQFTRWDATVPYDISSGNLTQVGTTLTVSAGWVLGGGSDPYDQVKVCVQWFNNGNQVFISSPRDDRVIWADCSTPYDLTSAYSYLNTYSNWQHLSNKNSGGGSYNAASPTESADTAIARVVGEKLFTFTRELSWYQNYFHNYFDVYDVQSISGIIGAPNSLFIESSNVTDGGSDFTTMKTTGYFYEIGSTTINTATQDATGVGTTVTIKGINPNTEVRMYRVSDDSEIAGVENSTGTQTSLAYNFVSPEDTYIVIHNTDYTTSPSRVAFTTQSAAATLTVFQQLDRAYSNP